MQESFILHERSTEWNKKELHKNPEIRISQITLILNRILVYENLTKKKNEIIFIRVYTSNNIKVNYVCRKDFRNGLVISV